LLWGSFYERFLQLRSFWFEFWEMNHHLNGIIIGAEVTRLDANIDGVEISFPYEIVEMSCNITYGGYDKRLIKFC
jgi:hypothetical protein